MTSTDFASRSVLRCRRDILSDDPRVPGSNAEQRKSGPVRRHPILLPILQRAHADAEGLGKLFLGQLHESAERGDIAGLETPSHDALALVTPQRARELFPCPFGRV
jgi:hypothetical protein